MRLMSIAILLTVALAPGDGASLAFAQKPGTLPPAELAEFFRPPEKYRNDFGTFRSPLKFADGGLVKSAQDWPRRRAEILETWRKAMGPWPAPKEWPTMPMREAITSARRARKAWAFAAR